MNNELKHIIEKWGNKTPDPKNYIFPILSNGMTPEKERAKIHDFTKFINTWLKKIAIKIGLEKNISTITARHSFATIMKRSGAPPAYIQDSLGHHNPKTTENYLDSFEDKVKHEYSKLLLDFKN